MASNLGRMLFSGRMPSGELFNYNVWVRRGDSANINVADLATAADQFQSTLLSGATPLKAQYHPSTVWSTPAVSTVVVATGKTDQKTFGTNSTAGSASGSVNPLPPEVAVRVSLYAQSPTRPVHGGWYLPPPNQAALDNAGNMNLTVLAVFAGAAANAYTAIGGESAGWVPVLYSPTSRLMLDVYKGNVGNVFDRMGTRRNKLVETREDILA